MPAWCVSGTGAIPSDMSEAILVSHPAPVRHVPRGARKERTSIVRMATPAMLRSVDPDAFAAPLGADGKPFASRLRLREGRFWTPLRFGGPKDRATIGAADLRAFLRGDIDPESMPSKFLTSLFRRSPLVAVRSTDEAEPQVLVETGDPVDVEASRSVAHDGRAALAAFVEDDIALVGGEAWARVRPLARYRHEGTDHRVTLLAHPFATPSATMHLGLRHVDDGIRDFRMKWDRDPEWSAELRNLSGWAATVPDPQDDVVHLANILAEIPFRIPARRYDLPGGLPELDEVRAGLASARYAGMTGRIGLAEAPDVLKRVLRAAEVHNEKNRYGPLNHLFERVRTHLEDSILPRLSGTGAQDDADLAALAP
jgi:hypothetical protein